jgi:formylglycine-generating enzyme required for sulfatase activity
MRARRASEDGRFGVKIARRSSIFCRDKRFGLWVLLPLMFAAIAAWRAGTAPSVAAQTQTKVNPKDGLTYVWIPPGTFQMGCSPGDSECNRAEKPAHQVTLTSGFWIGQTLVTQAAYTSFVGSNPSIFHGDQLPVEQVSWDGAQAYCKATGMRLPTEAEWEYAARGGTTGAGYAPLVQIAWYSANSDGSVHPVAQKQPNAYGLYDMLGNVWEWVADWFGPYSRAGAVDPKGPPTGQGRVLRGGSWCFGAPVIRVSFRVPSGAGLHDYSYGFRCAGN